MTNELLDIEVAYVKPGEQIIRALKEQPGITVGQAIKHSGIIEDCPEIDLAKNKVGVFGKAAKLDAKLHPGDRVEIYRPLIADPKEARKRRAKQGKALKKGGGNQAD